MKTFSEIQSQVDTTLSKDIRGLLEHLDGRSFRGVGGPDDFGRGGYDDPHHLSGRGQLLDVLIRKLSQLGVENDELAQEVAEKLGLELGDSGGIQKLLKLLKCHALGLTAGDLPTDAAKREVLQVASQIAAHDMEDFEERPVAPEGHELKRAPQASRTPPNQGTGHPGDPLGYSNQGNLEVNMREIRERFRTLEAHFLSERRGDNFTSHKTRDHVKLFSGKVEAYTRRNGLWTDYDEVKVPTVYDVDVWWDPSDLKWGETDYARIDVHVRKPKYDGFGRTGLIYTDADFERNVNNLAKRAGFKGRVEYTEQGMQGRDWVSMETGRAFFRELKKRFPKVVEKLFRMEESVELQEDKTDRELKAGLEQFIKDARAARRAGNRRLASQIRRVVMQVVARKGLDAQRIMSLLDEGYDSGFEAKISLGEDITPLLRTIVDRKQAAQVQFDNKKRRTVDLFTASAIIAVHDALNQGNQEKLRSMLSKNEMEFDRAVQKVFQHAR